MFPPQSTPLVMSECWDNEVGIPSAAGGRELRTTSGRTETCCLPQGAIMVITTIRNNKSKAPKALSHDAMAPMGPLRADCRELWLKGLS